MTFTVGNFEYSVNNINPENAASVTSVNIYVSTPLSGLTVWGSSEAVVVIPPLCSRHPFPTPPSPAGILLGPPDCPHPGLYLGG